MGEKKHSAPKSVAAAKQHLSEVIGLTSEGLLRVGAIPGLLAIIDRGDAGAAVADKMVELAPDMLRAVAEQIAHWRYHEHSPFLTIFGVQGRPHGCYMRASSFGHLTRQILPVAVARARAPALLTAAIIGVDDAYQAPITETLASIEDTIDPEAHPLEDLNAADIRFEPPFDIEVPLLHRWAYSLGLEAPTTLKPGSPSPLYQHLSDGWLDVTATVSNVRARACVPPTHWRLRGAAPTVAPRERMVC